MSDEVTRLLCAAQAAAPGVLKHECRAIVKAVLNELDALIDENDEDSTWPDADDLGLLAADLT